MQGVTGLPQRLGRIGTLLELSGEKRKSIRSKLSLLQGAIQFQYKASRSKGIFRCFTTSNEHVALLRFQTHRFRVWIDKFCQSDEI